MTKEEMWKEFENQLVRETRTPMTMSYDASEKMTKFAIKETVAKWKEKLEQQPSDDCVSRKAVFEAIDDCNSDGLKGIFCSYEDGERFKEYIKKLPPVTPTQSWIPVSERLPEEDGEYLLYGKIDEDEENYIFIGEYDSCGEQFGIWQEQFDRTTLGCLGSEFFDYSSVIAWQPLPKPYEEKRGNEK